MDRASGLTDAYVEVRVTRELAFHGNLVVSSAVYPSNNLSL
jgi:hypothetical protein